MEIPLGSAWPLKTDYINLFVAPNRIGVYMLGPGNIERPEQVQRVGRSEDCLNERLKDYIGEYTHFRFATCEDMVTAYQWECELYHRYRPGDNVIHPDQPEDMLCSCPVDGCEHSRPDSYK